jgi:tRNA (adenine22-N1)-methyltransferase
MAAIAAMVKPGSRLADIGTDHAYLPVYLVTEGIIQFAVAGDVNHGPFLSAVESIKRYQLTSAIDVRLGDGFNVLIPGEVDTVILAGMGGAGIIGILSRHKDITSSLSRLILQPMLAAGAVRHWLVDNGWHLVDETLVEDDGRIYEIIVAEQGESHKYPDIEYDIGPLVWEKRHPLLKDHLALLIAQTKHVVVEMSVSMQAIGSPKYKEYVTKIIQLEERYKCL